MSLFSVLCVFLSVISVQVQRSMSENDRSRYIRSPLARTIYSKMLMDESLRNMDLKELYIVTRPDLLTPTTRALWVPLGPDAETHEFLASCSRQSEQVLMQVLQEVARGVLGLFLQQTSINGLLNRGRMFVWSKDQAKMMLSSRAGQSEASDTVDTFYDAHDSVGGGTSYDNEGYIPSSTLPTHDQVALDMENSNLQFDSSSQVHSNPCPSQEELTSIRLSPIFPFPLKRDEPITAYSVTPKSDQKQCTGRPNPLQSLGGIEFPDERPARPVQAFDVGLSDPSTSGPHPPTLASKNERCDEAPEVCREIGTFKTNEVSDQELKFSLGSEQNPLNVKLKDNKQNSKSGFETPYHETDERTVSEDNKYLHDNIHKATDQNTEYATVNVDRNRERADMGATEMYTTSNDETSAGEGVDEDASSYPWQGRHVLDVGAGDGHVTRIIADEAASVSATEISAIMRARLRRKGYRVLDAHHWPSNDDVTYDVVTCLNLLDRHEDPPRLMGELRGVLKPEGRLVLALVLPYRPYVEYESSTHHPDDPLPLIGNTFEEQLNCLVDTLMPSWGFKVQAWSKVPYYCEGDLDQTYYWLDDVILVATKL